jgi:alkylation response protein AidB-like acyl-CoA dehydrogenase
MELPNPLRGGAFLLDEATPEQILTSEELSSEARLMAKTMEDFLRRDVLPVTDRLEAQEEGLMPRLIRKAGELGFLGAGLPERYGGLDLPKSAIALVTETMGANPSFAISVGVHGGVASLPLLSFGTEEQKQTYLPRLASGEWIGAFALSEANSGSDATAAQTRATLTPDGKHYRLNGTKMWITNGGFADLFTVFAQVDGEQFTAFLVERTMPGVQPEREEHKLGLHGSSTRRLVLENAQVPVENVLGEIGKGHRPAFYALNIGRFHIGATALGFAKAIFADAVRYAKQRIQFDRPIAEFGLIQHKIGEMAARLFMLESMVTRTAGCWDSVFGAIDPNASDAPERYQAASEEYAIECALIKFFGTETLDYVVDESLQMHGGFGFSEEFSVARAYRDARVFRIFEGTNEINRLTVLDQLLRRGRQNRLPLTEACERAEKQIQEGTGARAPVALLDRVAGCVREIRKVFLYTLSRAQDLYDDGLMEKGQEIVSALADIAAALYGAESVHLRCRKLLKEHALAQDFAHGMNPALVAALFCAGTASDLALQRARYVFACLDFGNLLHEDLLAIRHLQDLPMLDTLWLRRELAAAALKQEAYPW